MGNQIVVHRPDYEDSKRKKSTTDISLKSIVAKERREMDKLKIDYSSTTDEMRAVAQNAQQLITADFDRIYTACNLVYDLLANMYFHSSARGNFSVYQKAAQDYMKQFPQYFEV